MLELVKLLVQVVALERDADGKIIGEKLSEPTALYDLDTVSDFVENLRREIETANQAALNGDRERERA
jgi:hypothetical protein